MKSVFFKHIIFIRPSFPRLTGVLDSQSRMVTPWKPALCAQLNPNGLRLTVHPR